MARIKKVNINVSCLFFDKIFEKERKRQERLKGITFSQTKFTEFLAKSRAKFAFPKMSNKFLSNGVKKFNQRKKR